MHRLKKLVIGTAGSEIAEAALVLPILFMLLIGIYWFGRAFNVYSTINHAAREGARVAVAPQCATCAGTCAGGFNCPPTTDSIATQVSQTLQASRIDPNQVTHLQPAPTRTACAAGAPAVSCTVPATGPPICVYYGIQLPNALPGPGSGAPACGVSVEFQYPYQFLFPFTSLNMQKIMLNAGVQMAGEY
jgi:TadE-like protein